MIARLMGLQTISPEQLKQRVAERSVLVIDVNARERWAEAHVPTAIHLDPRDFRETDLPADKEQSLVFYCSGPLCRKAPNAARRAEQFGHRDVKVLSAGIQGWLAAGLPTEKV